MKPASGTFAAIEAGDALRLGAAADGGGTNFAVVSRNAAQIDLCLFDANGTETRITLPERSGDIWHGYLPGIGPGTLYGYRAHGAHAPQDGHRFNPAKLLLDPYTPEVRGAFTEHPAIFGYLPGNRVADLSLNPADSAPFVPRSVVPDPAALVPDAQPMGRGWGDTVIYEAHVRGATMLHPDVTQALRGTVEGLASDAMLDHLTRLGVTAIELLPIHALRSESHLTQRGLVNYWGYNTLGFFAPEPRYLGPAGFAGLRAMVDRFHAAGIEVLLDVVYNHTGEGDHLGPTLAFRGLDNALYYRLQDNPRYYVNDTGTGNMLDLTQPMVLRMVMDSLRFWAQTTGVDGFRFDLATTLGRTDAGFDPAAPFLSALRQDPLLSRLKLIAEPWDIGPGGYQLGNFPPEFAEWNDSARDTVRRFWRRDAGAAQALGSTLLGTAARFDRDGRRAWASVNFVAAHDGFTAADTTRYARRHNHANGEGNRDGHGENHSDNFGVEGPPDDPAVTEARRRRVRAMLATVFLSQGTPMLLAGDEIGHSQRGNNNAYCQDNDTTWLDWAKADTDLTGFVAALARFRADHPVLRQTRFLHGEPDAGGQPNVTWMGFDGQPPDWGNPPLPALAVVLRSEAEAMLLAFNRAARDQSLRLPAPARWCIDSSKAVQADRAVGPGKVTIPAGAAAAFVLLEHGA